jgi:hypothetical protein
MFRASWVAALVIGVWACGDNYATDPGPDPGPDADADFLDRLNALPGVTAVVAPTQAQGYTFYRLRFTQPVDHDASDGPTFEQSVSLLHKDVHAPMIAFTTGYWDYYVDARVELTRLLGANQISIEHRYFGDSRPEPADWSKLTIAQMAADEHVIISELRTLYDGAFVTTGGSKGGMTAVYHRRFYPDDVDGTVPYVAPQSFGAPDARYATFLDTLGPADCRQAVRDAATEMLAHRRDALVARATSQATDQGLGYTRIAIGPAVESAVVSLEWAFWQYYGVTWCSEVPTATSNDDAMWQFLDQISPPSDNSDAQVAAFDAYYYQAYAQLGYPDGGAAYLDALLQYTDADYAGSLPTVTPTYDGGAAMHDIDQWVQGEGSRLLFVYGQWDPWTGGKFDLGQATDSLELIQAEGTHNSHLTALAAADEQAALDKIAAWTGVTPTSAAQRARELDVEPAPREPRIPPAMLRALHARAKLRP